MLVFQTRKFCMNNIKFNFPCFFSDQKISHGQFKVQICMFFLQTRNYRMFIFRFQICMLFFGPENIAWSIKSSNLHAFFSDQKKSNDQFRIQNSRFFFRPENIACHFKFQFCMPCFTDQKISHDRFKLKFACFFSDQKISHGQF